jgi:hypothetical protein
MLFSTHALMEVRKTAIERAFELAGSGKCLNLSDVIKRLKSERYNAAQIEGAVLRKQLLSLIEKAKRPL